MCGRSISVDLVTAFTKFAQQCASLVEILAEKRITASFRSRSQYLPFAKRRSRFVMNCTGFRSGLVRRKIHILLELVTKRFRCFCCAACIEGVVAKSNEMTSSSNKIKGLGNHGSVPKDVSMKSCGNVTSLRRLARFHSGRVFPHLSRLTRIVTASVRGVCIFQGRSSN